jgi:outer membrane protein assembly factor BamB
MASRTARRSFGRRRAPLIAVSAALTAAIAIPAGMAAASSAPSATKTVTAKPAVGPPQSPVTVTAKGFGAKQRITIRLGTKWIGSGVTTPVGTLTVNGDVPASALPGEQTITATTTKNQSASTDFLVRTNWPEQRFGPTNRASNFRENVLTRAAAAHLALVASGPSTDKGGYSSLANGILYFNDPENLDTVAMNAATHQVIWTSLSPAGQASGAPAVDDGLVFVDNFDGGFTAYNATDGSLAWSGLDDSFSAAPVFANGIVYAQGNQTALYALDETTGNIIWQDPYAGSGAPAIVNGVLYAGTSNGVYALNPATGAVLWNFPGVDAGSVSYANNNLYFNGVTVQNTSAVYSISLTGTLNWSTAISIAHYDPAVADGLLYQRLDNGSIDALNLTDGSIAWTSPQGYIFSSVPAAADGVLYMGDDNRNLDAINDATGAIIASVPTPGNLIYGQPIIANGYVYAGASADGMYTFTTTTPPGS